MNPKVRKVLMWGFVLPFWLGIGVLMLLGIYSSITNRLELHALNATAREVVVRACSSEVRVPARGRARLETQCFGRPSSVTTSAGGVVVETAPFPDLGDKKPSELVYNVEGAETYDVVDHSAQYMDEVSAAVAQIMPGGVGNRAKVIASLRGTRIVALPEWTKLVGPDEELPSSKSKDGHVVRLERPKSDQPSSSE
jgi:hypothetical protein